MDHYFVHLHSKNNGSEILPQDHIQQKLGCFYHGIARQVSNQTAQESAVVISLCGGLRGFILPNQLPSSGAQSQQFHYVIHPLPNSFLPFLNERHHIIVRRLGSPFTKPDSMTSKPLQESSKNESTSTQNKRNNSFPGNANFMHRDAAQNIADNKNSKISIRTLRSNVADDYTHITGTNETASALFAEEYDNKMKKRKHNAGQHSRQHRRTKRCTPANFDKDSKEELLSTLRNAVENFKSKLTIEIAVFVDKDLYTHVQQNFPEDTQNEMSQIVLAMINSVQLLYHDQSLGHQIDFVLKRLEILEEDPPFLVRPYDIDKFIHNFCKWQRSRNPDAENDPLHWDHAIMLTGLDLRVVNDSGKIDNHVVGRTYETGMCTRNGSCTVIEARHFQSFLSVTQEIAHSLGIRDDGPQGGNDCDPNSHIMSPTMDTGKLIWSTCSKKYLDLFLETPQEKCLLNKAKPKRWLDHNGIGQLPGQRFDADRQCALIYGKGSFHASLQPMEDICRDLQCLREFFTWTLHPALEGTKCSPEDDMWCRAGRCVPIYTRISFTSLAAEDSDLYEISSVASKYAPVWQAQSLLLLRILISCLVPALL